MTGPDSEADRARAIQRMVMDHPVVLLDLPDALVNEPAPADGGEPE